MMGQRVTDRSSADLTWFGRAACRHTTVDMVPEDGAGVRLAKQICRECPVRTQCLNYALEFNEDKGVWGGHSERERRRIRQQRARAALR